MKRAIYVIALLAAVGSCKNANNTENTQGADVMEPVQEVKGRVNFGGDHAVITPEPCLMIATWDADGNPDVMMAAWGGQRSYNLVEINLSEHKTTENLRLKGAFTLSFASVDNVVESDFFGLVSANNVPDKVKKAGFTFIPSPNVDAPIIKEYPLTLECKVVSFEDGHLIGRIVNMSAEESVLDENGRVDIGKLRPIVYDSSTHVYRVVGEVVGQAWNSGKVLNE